MNEEWKWVTGFEGIYQISNYGRLKSFKKYSDGYILSNTNVKGGYLSVILTDSAGKKKRCVRIHVLVAEHFIGDRPEGLHIHHKDGNKQNNVVSNLEYITVKDHYKETLKDCPQIVTGITKYNKFQRPQTVQQYSLDGDLLAEYRNAHIAQKMTGICSRNILQVAGGTEYKPGKKRVQAGGYVWKFKDEREVV